MNVSYIVGALIVGFIGGFIVGKCAKKCRCGGKCAGKNKGGQVEIYVGNMSYDTTEDLLKKEFQKFGKVDSARVITTGPDGRSKGYAFVIMPNRDEATAAIKALHNRELQGRRLRVNEAKRSPKEKESKKESKSNES